LRVARWETDDEGRNKEAVLAKIEDLSLLHFCGLLAHRPRNAFGLEALVSRFFDMPVEVEQFRGQWLRLDEENRSHSGTHGQNNLLGTNVVVGERVRDIQAKIRLRIGPLRYWQFVDLLPNRATNAEGKTFFLLMHLVRLYCGPERDCEVQLILRRDEVPACRLNSSDSVGARLGWNTWSFNHPMTRDPDDSVFQGEVLVWTNAQPRMPTVEMAPLS
jgi:type VI secretion system protein ImpH